MIRTMLLGSMVLFAATGSALGQEPKQAADARAKLTYGGKPFAYWQNFSLTELRSEERIDAIRAMAAFGSRGYAKEAVEKILEILTEYHDDELQYEYARQPGMTPDQRVTYEGCMALRKIGTAATPVVLAHLDRQTVRNAALYLHGPGGLDLPIESAAIPALVRAVQAKDEIVRDAAVSILLAAFFESYPASNQKKGQEALFRVVAAEKSEKGLAAALEAGLNQMGELRQFSILTALGKIGPGASEALPTLRKLLQSPNAELRQAAAAAIEAIAAKQK